MSNFSLNQVDPATDPTDALLLRVELAASATDLRLTASPDSLFAGREGEDAMPPSSTLSWEREDAIPTHMTKENR